MTDLYQRGLQLIERSRKAYNPKPAICNKGPWDWKRYWYWRHYFDPRRDGVSARQRGKHLEG